MLGQSINVLSWIFLERGFSRSTQEYMICFMLYCKNVGRSSRFIFKSHDPNRNSPLSCFILFYGLGALLADSFFYSHYLRAGYVLNL